MITLSNTERKTVEDILITYATDQPYQVLVFGSRVNGKAKQYSDVDLALLGAKTVSPNISAALAEAFDNSSLPYTVDIIDGKSASSQLLEQIHQHGEELIQL